MVIGKINTMLVHEKIKYGYLLKSLTSERTIELRIQNEHSDLEDHIEVFIYVGKDKDLLATIDEPYAQLDEYGFLHLLHQNQLGSFFDLGLDKDLLVPVSEQKFKMERGEHYIVRICKDPISKRLFGSTLYDKFTPNRSDIRLKEKDAVEIVPVETTDLGYKVIINKIYLGLIYHTEIFQELECAQSYQGVIKKIREDGLIDAALQVQGIDNLRQAKDKILSTLIENKGQLNLHDKSKPEDIKKMLSMSKKTFKQAIGMLYKEKKIKLFSEYIELIA